MKKLEGKNIIVELIPNHSNPECGDVVQLQALKLNNLELIDRFDYRVVDRFIENKDLLAMISYDKDKFDYVENPKNILKDFKRWSKGYKLLIIDNFYTLDYLREFNNKESIFNYLDMTFSNDVIDQIITKYHLEPSNHIVDLLYEALIYASNKE